MNKIDTTDFELLNLLQNDARQTNKELANKLGLTITPVYERVKRLEKQGVIRKYVALLNQKKLGKHITTFIAISLRRHKYEQLTKFIEFINNLPEVMECYHISGRSDYLLKVVANDMDEYQNFIIRKLSSIENIEHIESLFVMNEIKHTTALKL